MILRALCITVLLAAATPSVCIEPGWQAETRITDDPAYCAVPPNNGKFMAVDLEGALHLVWTDERDRNMEVYHAMKFGELWTENERVTFDPAFCERPVLAVDNVGRVHLVWNDSRDGNKEIYHRIWDGAWFPEKRVTNSTGDSFGSSTVSEGAVIHLVHMEDIGGNLQVMYRFYDGWAWSAPVQLTNVSTGDRMVPCIDRGSDGSLHVVWWDTRVDSVGVNGKVCYKRRVGGVWEDEEILTPFTADCMRPAVAVDESLYVHVVWIDGRGGPTQIYYRRRGGAGWESEVKLTRENATHYHPSIDAAGSRILLTYWDNHLDETNSEVFFKQLTNGEWSAPFQVSNAPGLSFQGCVLAEKTGNIHVAWLDTRDGNQEIYYREYIDPQTGVDDDTEEQEPAAPFPAALALGASPNPFRGSTTLELASPTAAEASIRIFSIDGACVRTIAERRLPRGSHSFAWDGRDGIGRSLPSGVYIAVARAGKATVSRKVVLLH